MYASSSFWSSNATTKNRDDKEEADRILIESFLQAHNMETNSLVHDAGLVISSQKVKQFESDIDHTIPYFRDVLIIEQQRNAFEFAGNKIWDLNY